MTIPYSPIVPPPNGGLPLVLQGWFLRLADVVNLVLGGKLNATIERVSLTPNVAGTAIIDARISPTSVILFMPLTAAAAGELGAGTMYVSSQTAGSAMVTHTNSGSTLRDFRVLIVA